MTQRHGLKKVMEVWTQSPVVMELWIQSPEVGNGTKMRNVLLRYVGMHGY